MTLDIGVIGLGGLGRVQSTVLDDMDDVRVVGGADVAVAAREAFEREIAADTYEDYNDMIEHHDLDAVAIVTPHELHRDQVEAAFQHDINVHVEKPLVTRSVDAAELIDMANERDLVFQVGYQRHFDPAYREIRRLIGDGEIGEVHMVSCYLGQAWTDSAAGTWRMDPELSGGGQLIDSGSHLLDVLLWTTDTEPAVVTALTDNRGHDVDVDSAVAARLVGEDGRSVTASIGVTGEGAGFTEHLAIWGTAGRVTYGADGFHVEREGRPSAILEPGGMDYREGNRRKLAGFLEAVRTGTEPPVPASFGLHVTQLTEAAYRAAERGEVIDVDEL